MFNIQSECCGKTQNFIHYLFRQLNQQGSRQKADTIAEEDEHGPPLTNRTRHSTRISEKLVKTSDYSSEESLDRLKAGRKEILQVS